MLQTLIDNKPNNPRQKWIEYLKRANRDIREGATLKLYREVGKHYGLTDKEMDEIVLKGDT